MDLSKDKIKELIGDKECPIILDIGCYSGKDAAEIAALFDKCEVHCFEADPRSIALFEKENGGNPKLHLWKCAIGSIEGNVTLHQSHHSRKENYSGSSSTRKPKNHLVFYDDIEFNQTIEVDCYTLDVWRQAFPIIDFIWVDVNGAEEDVIAGATETLKITRYLYLEFSDYELYEGQGNKEKLLSMLPDFEETGVYGDDEHFKNVLLKNKKL